MWFQLTEATAKAQSSQSEQSPVTAKASVQQTSMSSPPALEEEVKDLKTQLNQCSTEIKGKTLASGSVVVM